MISLKLQQNYYYHANYDYKISLWRRHKQEVNGNIVDAMIYEKVWQSLHQTHAQSDI